MPKGLFELELRASDGPVLLLNVFKSFNAFGDALCTATEASFRTEVEV